jgi:putative ABC transport system ATP-binding protein
MITNPRVLLADEPTGNLDSTTSLDIMQCFSDLHRQGATIVMVTHDEDVAAAAQRIVRLRDGRVE